jgi:hypothetical protein
MLRFMIRYFIDVAMQKKGLKRISKPLTYPFKYGIKGNCAKLNGKRKGYDIG